MDIYSSFVLAFGISALFTGFLVLIDKPESVSRLFFIYSLFLFGWAMGAALMLNNNTQYQVALRAIRIGDAFILFVPVIWVHLVVKLTNELSKRSWNILRWMYGFCLSLLPFAFTDAFIPLLKPIIGFDHYKVAGPLYHFFTVFFVALVPYGFFRLFRHIKKLSGEGRSYSAMLGFALVSLIGYIGGSLCIVPAYGIPCPQYALLLMPIYPFGLGYFMIRRGLFSEEDLAQAAHKDKLAALGILTASINHEIRAPLFVIRGTVETETDNSKIKERVINQVDRLTGIVSRLTHFAKKGVEEAAQIEAIDLKDILADIRPLFQHQLNYQQIEYNQEVPNDLPKVLADRRYLEEILFNLILNACQALKSTSNPKITLRALKEASSIVIAVEDNGFGIPPEQLKTIFKPFHTTKQEGTGLGLYITKQLVEKCGGKIKIWSELDKGAIFALFFPGV